MKELQQRTREELIRRIEAESMNVKGGAAGVGAATTSSVVTAITVVIGVDTLYNVVYVNFFPT